MREKNNFKIFAICIKENSGISSRLNEKTLLCTVRSKGNLYTINKALQAVYNQENWKLVIE